MNDERSNGGGDLLDVHDRGDPDYAVIGKARNPYEAGLLAVRLYREQGYVNPQPYGCELIENEHGEKWFEIEVTYADLEAAAGNDNTP